MSDEIMSNLAWLICYPIHYSGDFGVSSDFGGVK